MFLLQHNGSQSMTRMANDIQNLIEGSLGYDIQQAIGKDPDDLVLLTENFQEIGRFNTKPNLATLELYLSLHDYE